MLTATAVASRGWLLDTASSASPSPYPVVVNTGITSWAQLAAVTTTTLPLASVIAWVEASTLILIVTQLLAGTDATDTANGVQRPNDFNSSTNAKVWFQVGYVP